MAVSKIKVKLIRSVIHSKPQHRKTVKALGLGKINSTVEHNGNPAIMGMVRSVRHLVEVEEVR
jgi:large subunit ribosomal protein L30